MLEGIWWSDGGKVWYSRFNSKKWLDHIKYPASELACKQDFRTKMTASRNLGDAHNFWWQILWGAIIQPGLIKLSCFQLCAPGPLSFELFKYCDFTASDKHKGFYINSYLIVWPQSILLHWTGSFVVRILDIMNWPYRSLWPDGQWNAQKRQRGWIFLNSIAFSIEIIYGIRNSAWTTIQVEKGASLTSCKTKLARSRPISNEYSHSSMHNTAQHCSLLLPRLLTIFLRLLHAPLIVKRCPIKRQHNREII